jgi:8-oxo-(d)GTP phosphatase
MSSSGPILAAGAVVARKRGEGLEIALVHRPKYDDWSFPKGKLEPGEHPTVAAVREVAEETGLDIRLGPPLSRQTYQVRNGRLRTKHVDYWAGRIVGNDDLSRYEPNDEIDQATWVDADKARQLLSYDHDRETLDEFLRVRKNTYPLLVVRHARARARQTWRREDRDRPLTPGGELQAEHLVSILGAYGVSRLISSSSRRCWTTLGPYAEVADIDLEETADLSEEESSPEAVRRIIVKLMREKHSVALCTHRPVLPMIHDALELEHQTLDPGALLAIHHRKKRLVAVELVKAPLGH